MIESPARPVYPVPLPDWVAELRPQQPGAVNEILEAYAEGVKLVILDAPTGGGKTLVAELVRRELQTRGLYLCSDKGLQDQVERDFPYAAVLKGRANYPTELRPDLTCEDCTRMGENDVCFNCNGIETCPYQVAKRAALAADLAVTNTAMFLLSANYANFLTENRFVIADEGDMIEEALIRFVAYEVPEWALKVTGLDTPIPRARKNTIARWLGEFGKALVKYQFEAWEGLGPKRRRGLVALISGSRQVRQYLVKDMEHGLDDEGKGFWFRDYDTWTFKLRPVTVSGYGQRMWWRHADRWLLMSGTVVSAQELVESLGWTGEYRVVTVPSTFPAENRPIHLAGIAEMTKKAGERDWPRLMYAIAQILARHHDRVLIHAVSYKLTNYIVENLSVGDFSVNREVISHTDSLGKTQALKRFLSTESAVLISPSMVRGVDLKGDACRVQIIAKCPFPSLGDKQVSLRLHTLGGQLWYAVRTVRDIVQMSGRAVRSEEDWAVTYILDQQFSKNIWSRYKALFTPSFTEVIKANQNIRWLMPEYKAEFGREERSA